MKKSREFWKIGYLIEKPAVAKSANRHIVLGPVVTTGRRLDNSALKEFENLPILFSVGGKGASMSIAIPSSLASVAAASVSSTVQVARNPQPATNPADKVTLTESQQVYQLYNQGQHVPQIASALNLPENTVNLYLGITSSA